MQYYIRDNRRLDIIWNMTSICPWNCKICCVDAKQVSIHKETKTITIKDSISSYHIDLVS